MNALPDSSDPNGDNGIGASFAMDLDDLDDWKPDQGV
jgi:hypothetical protein